VRLGHIFPFSLAFEIFPYSIFFIQLFGGYSEGDTPVPIPNTEVKPFSADGTARETAWESRTPPRSNARALRQSEGLFLFVVYNGGLDQGNHLETELIKLLEEKGPLTGAEIIQTLSHDPLLLWRTCKRSSHIAIRTIGRRYLRLDPEVEGFARLSPSILREFLTYSVIGIFRDQESLLRKAEAIALHIHHVSKGKLALVHSIFLSVLNRLENEVLIKDQTCVLLAGDIAYGMAHDVPRPERSTGKLVKGSDMDLVVVADDGFPKALMERMDEAIYHEKQKVLMAPHLREEIDYVVKDLARVRKQMGFDSFKHMVACKILQEGIFLSGSEDLFRRIKAMLQEKGITDKLIHMENRAGRERGNAENYLLTAGPDRIKHEGLSLFYPTEESEEFE
jgi:hypothetical protein